MKIRHRDPSKLRPLTVHGHHMDEYHVQVHPDDTVLDLKYILSPLVNNGNAASNIQMNFNTVRRLHDDELVVKAGCLSPTVVIMYWFEMENESDGARKGMETPIYQSVAKLQTTNPLFPDIATTIRATVEKFKNGDHPTFGYRQYLDPNDLTKRGQFRQLTVLTTFGAREREKFLKMLRIFGNAEKLQKQKVFCVGGVWVAAMGTVSHSVSPVELDKGSNISIMEWWVSGLNPLQWPFGTFWVSLRRRLSDCAR